MNEFELIDRFFASQPIARDDVIVGIGDDAAVLAPPAGQQLVVTTDTLVAGVHFPESTPPHSVGWKALAVNLSDLAAMGATPAWFTLNLTLPQSDPAWVGAFAGGLYALAQAHRVQLVGGDTTQGPLSITITACGFVPASAALLRRGARPGDRIYVTGTLGDAGLGLRYVQGQLDVPAAFRDQLRKCLDEPAPRVREGEALRGIASACIDVSDGLAADLGHILDASGAGATVDLGRLPLSDAYKALWHAVGGWQVALTNGDDYELCFTLPADRADALDGIAARFACGFACIGEVDATPGLRLRSVDGSLYQAETRGYDHFR